MALESLSFSTYSDICQDAFISPDPLSLVLAVSYCIPIILTIRPSTPSILHVTFLLHLHGGKNFAPSCALLRCTLKCPLCLLDPSGNNFFLGSWKRITLEKDEATFLSVLKVSKLSWRLQWSALSCT